MPMVDLTRQTSLGDSQSMESNYSVCTKKALLTITSKLGLTVSSKTSREELIKLIEGNQVKVTLKHEDLLARYKPILNAINREINHSQIAKREEDLVKEKILEIFGSSLSRLPYLTSKKMPDKKDWLAIQTISMNLELLHGILGTNAICKPGEVLSYDPDLHEGPNTLEPGQECLSVSTGIKLGNSILIKPLVITIR